MNIEIRKISGSVDIEKQTGRELVQVTLTAEVKSDNKGVVAAGVDVDGLEVLPSVRIEVIDGIATKTFPPVKIFRQYSEDGKAIERKYKLTVAIGTGQELQAVKEIEMTF